MSVGTASGRVVRCRLLVQELVGPSLQDAAVQVRRQCPTPGVHVQAQVEAPMLLPHTKCLAEHRDRPGHTHPPDEGHVPRCQWQPPRRRYKALGHLLKPQAATVLRRCLAPQPRVDVLRIDRLLQPRQFPTQVPRSVELPLQQRFLEPAVEVLHAAVELRFPDRDEHRADAVAEAEPDHSRQGPRRGSPTGQLAGVIQLDLLRSAQVLPALPEEPQDLVHAPGTGQAQANGAVEGVLAHPDVVAVAAALQVDRPHQIDLVELVGCPGLWSGVLLTWQQRGQADPRRRQAVALQDPLDGAFAGERADAQGLQLGPDGRGPDQAVAGGRRGMGLKPAADGEDRPLQLGWDALGDLVIGPGQVVETFGAGLQVASPPFVEPAVGTTDGSTDGLDGLTGEAQGNGAMTSREFVVHGYLRVAAAGGCPRRSFYTSGDGLEGSLASEARALPDSEPSGALSAQGDRD